MKVAVHIRLKDDILDPQGQAIATALARLGYTNIAQARVGKTIELDIDDQPSAATAHAQIDKMCREFLVNPVMEDYRVEPL